jgi:hypothetical protein
MNKTDFKNLERGDHVRALTGGRGCWTGRVNFRDLDGSVHVGFDVDGSSRKYLIYTSLELLDVAKGSGSDWAGLHGDELIKPGATVILGKHRGVEWSTGAERRRQPFVGRRAVVKSTQDTGGPRHASVDVDGRQHLWRVRDMTRLTPEFCKALDVLDSFNLEHDPAMGPRTLADVLDQAGLGALGQGRFMEWLVRADIAQWDEERRGYLVVDHDRLAKACSTLAGSGEEAPVLDVGPGRMNPSDGIYAGRGVRLLKDLTNCRPTTPQIGAIGTVVDLDRSCGRAGCHCEVRVEFNELLGPSIWHLKLADVEPWQDGEHPAGDNLPDSWQRALAIFWEKRNQFSVWDRDLLHDVFDKAGIKAGISDGKQIAFHQWLKRTGIMEVRGKNPKGRFVFCLERLGKACAGVVEEAPPPGWALGRQLRLREDSRDLKAGAVGIIRSLGIGACGDMNACIGCHASVEFAGGVYHLDLPELELYTLVADEACTSCPLDRSGTQDAYECRHCSDHPSVAGRGPWEGQGYGAPVVADRYAHVGTNKDASYAGDENAWDEAYVAQRQAKWDKKWREAQARQARPVVTATLDLAPEFTFTDRGDTDD